MTHHSARRRGHHELSRSPLRTFATLDFRNIDMLCAITLLATGASAFAPATKPAFNLQQQQRASAPLMQFNFFNDDRSDLEKYFDNEKKGKNKRTATKSRKTAKRTGTKSRVRGEFYDDEADTTAKPFWQWDAEQEYEDLGFRSPQEAAGFAPGGGDLANMGGVYYVAFIPFLLFFVSYVFGGFGELYGSKGNY